MFRKKTRSKSSFLYLPSSNRGSDITRPESSSLIVNQSDTEAEDLPKELTSVFSDYEDDNLDTTSRRSSSLAKSFSQKKQSTPLTRSIAGERGNPFSQKLNFTNRQSTSEFTSHSQAKKISFFEEVLKIGGASRLPGNSSYLMTEDQAVFSIKVSNRLNEDPENIKRFISSLKEIIKDYENLQRMLAHTLTDENCEVARGPVQEPLMRMLLNIDCLRVDLVELLLNVIVDFVVDNKVESEKVQLISSILRQMKFLGGMEDVKFASKLFEIIHMGSINVKREIIFLLPEIVSQEETEETCYQLLELLKFEEMLTHVIIDAMTNLPLNKTLRSQVCSKILNRLDKCPVEFLPSLVQFVLNKSDAEEHNEVINGLRKNLPFTPQHYHMKEGKRRDGKENSDDSTYVKVTFENLKFSVMASKQLADSWIKIISNLNSPTDFRCVDWIMLVIFYCCLFGKKNQILQIIRNKIRLSVLMRTQVQEMFKMLFVIAEEYCSPILELSSALLKSFEPKLCDFGASIYKECFIHFHFYMKQIVISDVLLHVGTGALAAVNTALGILRELCTDEKESLSQHTSSILGLLMKVQDLDLTQVRLLMDIMAELAFFEVGGSAVQDELQVFIRKQLMSSKCDQYQKGILAAIMFGKHSIGKEGLCNDADLTQINSLLEMAMGSSWLSETKRGFFNDEFATMIKESCLSRSFLRIWNEKTSNLVTENLFMKDFDVECSDFPMSLQYSLRKEGIEKLVFPVATFIIRLHDNRSLSLPVSVIPSTLRLLWCLEEKLGRVPKVFYASVIMPETKVYDAFIDLDESQKKKVLDCLFLCGNYLIECINAFCAHGIVAEAVLRLKQLIQVRKLIATHINLIGEYVPPVCQFYAPAQKIIPKRKISEKKAKKGRKRKLDEPDTSSNFSAESRHTLGTPTVCSQENVAPSKGSSQEADLHSYCHFFRELDFGTYKLLAFDSNSETVKMNKSMNSSVGESLTPLRPTKKQRVANYANRRFSAAVSRIPAGRQLGISFWKDRPFKYVDYIQQRIQSKPELEAWDILLLLEDLICKSEQVLKSAEVVSPLRGKPTASLMQKITPENFIKAAIEILPGLLKKIEAFSKCCENLLEANDWIYDSRGLCLQDACSVKLAMAAGLKLIAEIISWRGFQNSNSKLLGELVTLLSRKGSPAGANLSLDLATLAPEAANYLASFSKTILVLAGGLSIVKSCQVCLRYSSGMESAVADLCMEFLCREWFTPTGTSERGSVYNQNVDFLVKTYFSSVDNKLEIVRSTSKIALDEIGGVMGNDCALKTIKTINKGNFPILYRALCEALVSASTNELREADGNDPECLGIWNKIVETLLVLVETAKIHSSRVILASLLKRSQSIIQLFLSKGMLVVQSALRVKSVEVLTLLKSFQIVTRFLHSICCHSRITNDSLVAAHVPAIRSQCERLTLEVKGMLILNGIPMDCITIAILKNKDIKGNDIISQETLQEDSDDDSELPPEDTPDLEDEKFPSESY